MASYKNFTQESKGKYGSSTKNNTKDKTKKQASMSSYESVKDEFRKALSHFRNYPDHFIDYVKTENTRYNLTPFQRVFLRAFFRYKKTGIVASRGISKCITGDSILFTDRGMIEIGSLSNYKKEESEDIQDIEIVNMDGDIVKSDIIVSNGFKKTKKIHTNYGYEIEGTEVHPILVMNTNGDFEFKQMNELKIGDYVAINRKNNLFGDNRKLTFNMEEYLSSLNKYQHGIKRHQCFTPKELTDEFAYYLGLMMGDGCFTRDNCIIFSSIDQELYEFFISFNERVLGLNNTKTFLNDGQDFKVSSKYLREYLRQIGFGFENSNNKKIPKIIMESPKSMVSNFLRGLFDTDGTVVKSKVEFCTSSETMSKQVQVILLNFGIISKRKKYFNKKFKTYHYKICISTKNIDIFNKEIGFGLTRKQEKLDKLCGIKRNPNKDIIPYQNQRMRRVIDKNKNYDGNPRKSYGRGGAKMRSDFTHVYQGENDLTYERIERLFSEYKLQPDEDIATLLGLHDNGYYWDKIESIEDSENYVYDLHVPEHHTFIGNGFVNHNTYINVMAHYLKCIMYPNVHLCLAMPTKQQSAKVVEEKISELWSDYPILKNELDLDSCKWQTDYVKLVFRNGSTLDTLTVGSSSRGLRANGISLEELVDPKMDRDTINDVILPIVAQPRMTKHGYDPNEMSLSQAYITSASHRQSYCFEKYDELFEEMIMGKPTIVLGTSYEMGLRFGTLRESEVEDKLASKTYSPISFDKEFRSIFIGSSEKSLVSVDDINKCRTVTNPEFRADKNAKDAIYVLSYDIARAEGKQNAKSSLSVFKGLPRGDGSYQKFLVNLYTMEGTHFHEQALFLKQKVVEYNASILCIDHNGIGRAVTDILVTEIDGNPPYSVINDERYDKYKKPNSVPMLFLISSNAKETKNSDIINVFMATIANKDVKILQSEGNARGYIKEKDPSKLAEKLIPFAQVDGLVDEIMNLEYVQSGNTTSVRQISRGIEKDRFMSFVYGIFYFYLLERKNRERQKQKISNISDYFQFRAPKY